MNTHTHVNSHTTRRGTSSPTAYECRGFEITPCYLRWRNEKRGRKAREWGEENGTDNMAKLLFAQAGVMFDYAGQRISWVCAQRRSYYTTNDSQLMFSMYQ